ncbi:MAG: DoxX family protein [Hyphomonas sp.]
MPRHLLTLPALARYSDWSLLLLRLVTGAFLMWGTQDNIRSADQMAEFIAFLRHFGFAWPEVMAPLSVWAQFLCGALFILGALTRWAGLVMVFNFIVAMVMVHLNDEFRAMWPALALIIICLHLAFAGAGRWSVDAWLERRADS